MVYELADKFVMLFNRASLPPPPPLQHSRGPPSVKLGLSGLARAGG